MTTRKNISLSDQHVIEVFEQKVRENKGSAFVQECILFYLQYKPLIDEMTKTPNLLNLIKGGGANVVAVEETSQKKRNRIEDLLKRR